jgi:hypothetical protein
VRRAAVFKWWKRFRDGETNVKDEPRSDQDFKIVCSTILLKIAANGLQRIFEKWVERCKKCIACQGRYFEKRPSPHLHKTSYNSLTTFRMLSVLKLVPFLFCEYKCHFQTLDGQTSSTAKTNGLFSQKYPLIRDKT